MEPKTYTQESSDFPIRIQLYGLKTHLGDRGPESCGFLCGMTWNLIEFLIETRNISAREEITILNSHGAKSQPQTKVLEQKQANE